MSHAAEVIEKILTNVSRVIRGKEEPIRFTILSLLTGGHVLMEDVPGVGKTVLAKSLSRSLEGEFHRIQFTPDLLPADVTGTSSFDPRERTFEFRKGPIFANVLLADEINRASPRTQSALLEAMSEAQVSLDGETWKLPDPFLVIATQNPIEFHGTYPLPEAQLDRFAIRIHMGYPDLDSEVDILLSQARRHPFETLEPVTSLEDIREARRLIREVTVSRDVAKYMVELCRASRDHVSVRLGVSPRGEVALFKLAQARAAGEGRDYCMPDDVKVIARPVLAHRLVLETKSRYAGVDPLSIVDEIVDKTPVPA